DPRDAPDDPRAPRPRRGADPRLAPGQAEGDRQGRAPDGPGRARARGPHRGRPKGTVKDELRMAPVAHALAAALGDEVEAAGMPGDPSTVRAVEGLREGQVVLLENLRFDPGEESNAPAFAGALAELAD